MYMYIIVYSTCKIHTYKKKPIVTSHANLCIIVYMDGWKLISLLSVCLILLDWCMAVKSKVNKECILQLAAQTDPGQFKWTTPVFIRPYLFREMERHSGSISQKRITILPAYFFSNHTVTKLSSNSM